MVNLFNLGLKQRLALAAVLMALIGLLCLLGIT